MNRKRGILSDVNVCRACPPRPFTRRGRWALALISKSNNADFSRKTEFSPQLARRLHYSFFGSGSPDVAKAASSEIETRQCLDCWFLLAIKAFFFAFWSINGRLQGFDCLACIILMRIKIIHMFNFETYFDSSLSGFFGDLQAF